MPLNPQSKKRRACFSVARCLFRTMFLLAVSFISASVALLGFSTVDDSGDPGLLSSQLAITPPPTASPPRPALQAGSTSPAQTNPICATPPQLPPKPTLAPETVQLHPKPGLPTRSPHRTAPFSLELGLAAIASSPRSTSDGFLDKAAASPLVPASQPPLHPRPYLPTPPVRILPPTSSSPSAPTLTCLAHFSATGVNTQDEPWPWGISDPQLWVYLEQGGGVSAL